MNQRWYGLGVLLLTWHRMRMIRTTGAIDKLDLIMDLMTVLRLTSLLDAIKTLFYSSIGMTSLVDGNRLYPI